MAREYVDEAESGRVADRPRFRQVPDEGGKATVPFQVLLIQKNPSETWLTSATT